MKRKQKNSDLQAFFLKSASNQGIKSSISRGIIILGLILSFFSFSYPKHADASVFSFVSNFFNTASSEARTPDSLENSQTMQVLEAPLAVNLSSAQGGGEVTIVDGTSLVPETGPSGSLLDIENHANAGQISVYVVRPGDTLSQIAKMYNVTTNTIVWANDLQGKSIRPGDTLLILSVSGIQYTVKSGDTVEKIAKKYKADLREILAYNNLSEDQKLKIGDVLVIPDAELTASPSTDKKSVFSATPRYAGYYSVPIIGAHRTQDLHGYRNSGVDLAAPIGTPILASADGTVIIARNDGWNAGYGEFIILKHNNGTQTLYAHASQVLVYVGQRVKAGQQIAEVGSSGNSTGSHLHFEVRGDVNICGGVRNICSK